MLHLPSTMFNNLLPQQKFQVKYLHEVCGMKNVTFQLLFGLPTSLSILFCCKFYAKFDPFASLTSCYVLFNFDLIFPVTSKFMKQPCTTMQRGSWTLWETYFYHIFDQFRVYSSYKFRDDIVDKSFVNPALIITL